MYQLPLPNATKPYKQGCGALLYSKKTGRFLFLLRNKKYSGSWGLVGGKVENDESVKSALIREIREEIQIDITDNKIIPIETFTSDDDNFKYYTYLIAMEDEFVPTLNEEHRGYCWVTLADVPKPLHPGVWKTFNFNEVIDKINTVINVF